MTRSIGPGAAALRTATEPRRLQILELIWDRESSVSEIAAQLPVSIAAVSQHLAKLRDAGLVRARREGRQRFYRATKEDMGSLAIVLEAFWRDRLGALKRTAEAAERELDADAARRPRPEGQKGPGS
ncbi:MAG: metalloregulator ArsR/SmtB family transcription factor [Gemmatimonadetes bacterium]|nr:metalloregulator ArsR/SmtB family transcription factor [Gemmatimonadota bacterium]